ncbi:hypothetical protein [Flagellimonas algicola]|uniref:Peptidase MA-like domain-containing protein n=1 Tax=Flagellimonas algicola TaxID=2583815 RepID=A0ABY2WNP7_9FLAO|nr:hypothetical protein [Allomuricauda algicola]TMU56613.1 hypothetical protein FGG15_03475 [Allomuricauda algicola]
MKKLKYIIVTIALLILVLSIVANIPENRKEFKTTHFNFHYSSGIDSLSVVGLSKALEVSYSRVSSNLRTTPAERIEVNIYAQRWRYFQATGHWGASGSIEGIAKLHFMENAWLDTEISKIAVHEFVHAVVLKLLIDREPKPLDSKRFDEKFLTFPVWLWEGLSVYEAEQFYEPKTLAYFDNGNFPQISELNNRSAGQKIYTCGYTLIEYIFETYGRDKLIELVASYGDLKKTLNLTEEQFSSNWYEFIKDKYELR